MPHAPQANGSQSQLIQPFPVNSALIVEPVLADAVAVVSTLTARRFHVTLAETVARAKERLTIRPPELLVADIKLGEYNGLHLVLRAKSLRSDTAAIVTSDTDDPVLQADAEALGATFLLKPIVDAELAAAVFRTIFQAKQGGRGEPLRPLFERRVVQRRAEVIPMTADRRRSDRRRSLEGLLRAVARGSSPGRTAEDGPIPGR